LAPGRIATATVRTTSARFESDAARDLFPLTLRNDRGWDVSADGQRFLILAGEANTSPLTVVVNWQAGLKE
jgi:hypothetical protein